MKLRITLLLLFFCVQLLSAQNKIDLKTQSKLSSETGNSVVIGNNTTVGVIKPSGALQYLRSDASNAAFEFATFDVAWGKITSTPTTIGGYGITDYNSLGDARWSLLAHTHTFASLTSKPTTLSGYGITDAYPISGNPSGFLTSFTEADPIYSVSSWFSTTNNSSNWNTAYNNRITSATAPLDITSNVISIPLATSSVDGYLSATDRTNYQTAYTNRITSLTTTGSGAATLISNVLNIPTPSGSSPGGSSTNIQFNNGGIFAGSANLFWDNTNGQLGVLSAGSAALPNIAVGRTDLGFYNSSSDEIGFSSVGTVRYKFSNTAINSVTTGGFTLRRAAGAAATPTYAFQGGVGYGMWLNGTELAFSNNGVKNFSITAANEIHLNDASNTFEYYITPATLAASRILNLPLLTSTDTFVVLNLSQALTNKSINGVTLTTSGSASDFLNAQGNYVSAGGGGGLTYSQIKAINYK